MKYLSKIFLKNKADWITLFFLKRYSIFIVVWLLSCFWLLFDLMDYSPSYSSVHGIFLGKNSGVGCHFLLHGIFLAQGLNSYLLHWQVDSLPLSHLGSHFIFTSSYFKLFLFYSIHFCTVMLIFNVYTFLHVSVHTYIFESAHFLLRGCTIKKFGDHCSGRSPLTLLCAPVTVTGPWPN